uniref:Uncharacterized protein n=1 Tax=Quercus lobata TaxID=97700 RepID=A0A7N2MKN0_QUELO
MIKKQTKAVNERFEEKRQTGLPTEDHEEQRHLGNTLSNFLHQKVKPQGKQQRRAVTNLLNNESVSDIDRLHLVMLYALHYEKESPVQLMQLFNKLASWSAKYKPVGFENAYTQHHPHLFQTMESISKGWLRDVDYPYVGNHFQQGSMCWAFLGVSISSVSGCYCAVTNLLNNESSSDIDRLRLVMLYALRYKKENPVQLMQLFNKLASQSAKYKPGLVQFILKQAGVDKRTGDLFGNRDLLNIARNMARGLKHQPLLFQTMESISKGWLRDVDYLIC